MGIHGFFDIRVHKGVVIRDLGTEINLNKLRGQKICVDASLLIYNTILSVANHDTLTSPDGRSTAHIHIILNKLIQLKKAGIEQIWIFDSPIPNPIKERAMKRREERRKEAEETKGKSAKAAYVLNSDHVQDIQILLQMFGIDYIVAPPEVEAEQLGAYMTSEASGPICRYMLSADSDVLAFGGNLLRLHFTKNSNGSRKTIYVPYDLSTILDACEISRVQFVQMCTLMGTDFCDKIDGLGPARILSKIKDNAFFTTPAQEMALKYFMSDISGKMSDAKLTPGQYNRQALIDHLVVLGFTRSRLEKILPAIDYEPASDSEPEADAVTTTTVGNANEIPIVTADMLDDIDFDA